jgi:outer membrane protein assembly factor BamB
VRWQHSLDGRARSPPIVTEGTVFVGLGDGTVLALDVETGDPRWDRWVEGTPWVSATDGERLYLGNESTDVRALDAETGDDAWIHETDDSVPPVAVGDGFVLLGGSDLRALDADSGDPVWTVETEGQVFTPALADGVVYISTSEGRVHAIDEAVAGER